MGLAYAIHRPAGKPLGARVFRFRSSAIRGIRMEREPGRWQAVSEDKVRRLVERADARKGWKYEAPGVWSVRLGALRSLAWRARG